MQFIDLQAQYRELKSNIDRAIHTVLDHGKYIMGPEVFEFEEKLADYIGVKHAISCANGTDALQLSLMALGIRPDSLVVTTPFTFFATAEVVELIGANTIFSDIDPHTFNMCPGKLENTFKAVQTKFGKAPDAVIAVDLFGQPANYDEITKICQRYGVKLIEDAAQGLGGQISGKMAGSFGDIATTSFFPAKPLGCYGDGGAVFTNSDELAEVVKSIRVHGKGIDKYENVRIGMNSRLDTIQAAILIEKLAVFEKEIDARNTLADYYATLNSDILHTPFVPDGYRSSWAQYSVLCESPEAKNELQHGLNSDGIPSAVYYRTPLHLQSVFAGKDNAFESLKVSESVAGRILSLPMHPYMKKADLEKVLSSIQSRVK